MKYTIQEILPGQIKVEFEDTSWAMVPIPPNSSIEEIDYAVSQYDPDFLPSVVSSINPSISIGLERTSKQRTEESKSEQTSSQYPNQSIVEGFFKISVHDYLIGEYFAGLGDTRLQEEITKKLKAFVELPDYSVQNTLDRIIMSDDDIMKQAEEELNNGK